MGVYAWERQCLMTIYADIAVEIDLDEINDDIEQTVNYFTLSQALIDRSKQCTYQLMESLLIDLRNLIIGFDARIKSLNICLSKQGILKEAQSTSVSLSWSRDESA